MRTINEIIIHCSATPEGKDFHASDIDAWHKQQGWRGIGYHYVVTLDGSVETGRYISQPGAHCLGHNAHSIGICYIGGVDEAGHPKDTRTKAQKAALLKLVANLVSAYKCRVYGHNHFNKGKACPCFDVQKEYGNLYIRELQKLAK